MPKILYADNDYPDVDLERALFAAAGIEIVEAQCRTEDEVIAAAQGCRGILLQYAPIGAKVVAALPELGIVSRIGAGFDTVDTDACEKRGRLGREFARLRRRRGGHARAGAGAGVDPQHRCLSPRHRRRTMALPVVRDAAPAVGTDARHRRPRPHRQAHGAHVAQRVQARRRVRPLPHRRRLSRPTSSVRTTLPELARQIDVVSLHTPLNAETRGMVDAKFFAAREARPLLRQYVARRRRQPARPRPALDAGILAGAALDVLPEEPVPRDSPLLTHPACYPDAARGVLLDRGGKGVAAEGRTEHHHVVRDRESRSTS